MSSNFLQTFLIINAALVGGIIVLAVRYGMAHFRPSKHDAEHQPHQPVKLPPQLRQKMLEKASADFEKALENAVHQLELDLSRTATGLNKSLESFGTRIIEEEMKRYRQSLDELQQFASAELGDSKSQIDAHKQEIASAIATHKETLVARMNEEIVAEKQQILGAIDARLADANMTFLLETLGQQLDLGSQAAYLNEMIESHKDEFKKDVDDAA